MKKNLSPGTESKLSKVVFDNFGNGTVNDPPASEIQNAFSNSANITAFQKYFEGRTGCRKYGVQLPPIPDRTGYVAHKSGNRIISDSGDIFERSDVGCYFNWGNGFELITDFIDGATIIGSNTANNETSEGSIVGIPNNFFSNSINRKWVVVLAGRLLFADVDIQEWNSTFCISKESLPISRCDCSNYKGDIIVFTSNGIYKAVINTSFPIIYKINVPVPEIKLLSDDAGEDYSSSYRCLYSMTRIAESGNFVDRQSDTVIDIETGTNLPDETDADYSEAYTNSEISDNSGHLWETLWVPKVSSDSDEYVRHLTHFTLWRTMDLEAKDPGDVYKEKFNDPERFIWNKDLRICAAFYGIISDGIFTASVGEFEAADRYSVLELADGQRLEIYEVIDNKHVRIEPEYYDSGLEYTGAAAIGYGRVLEGSITDGVFNRTGGDSLFPSDAGKTLWSSEGERLYITSVISSDSATVHLNISQWKQGYTIDATHRNYYDTVSDTMLYAREDFYTCRNRYRRPLSDSNIGAIIPGFVVCATRGESAVYYSHLEDGFSQLLGQYVPNLQTSENIKSDIQTFWVFESILAVICSTETWGVTIGISEFTTLPSSTEKIALLAGFSIIDNNIGCLDIDSIAKIEGGCILLMTNEPGGESLRTFNGVSYSETDYLFDSIYGGRIKKELLRTIKKSIAVYDGHLGYVIWRKYKEG